MYKSSRFCQACVSQDRRLFPLPCLRTMLREIHLIEISSVDGSICWECASTVMKFYKFKKKAQRTQSLLLNCEKLQDLICASTLGFKTKCGYDDLVEYNADPLRAEITIKTEEISSNDNFREDEENKISFDDETLKEEQISEKADFDKEDLHVAKHTEDLKIQKPELEDDMFNSSDEIPLAEAKDRYENNIKSKNIYNKSKSTNKLNKPKKLQNNQDATLSEGELKKKYLRIEYTEEEMFNKRERKRNGPNFKVLSYKCESCVLGFKSKDSFDDHLWKKHDEKLGDYPCAVCRVRFQTQKKLEQHINQHYVCYKCCFCEYETTSTNLIQKHCRTKHATDEPDSIHCPHCDVVVRTPEEMSAHKIQEHPLYCDQCQGGEKFVSAQSLRGHKRRVHNSKRQFVCTLCNKPFKTKLKLESHTAYRHPELAPSLSYCQLCDIQYKSLYVYRSHLRNNAVHSLEPYQCSECNKKFASKLYMKMHYKFYHLKKSQYKCDQCSKQFISDYRLKNHMRTQHGVSRTRDYRCNVCGKQFFTQTTLKGHMQIHSERRSYMCEDCGDTFKQRPALYNHHRLVHSGNSKRKKPTL